MIMIKKIFLFLIKFYKKYLSPLKKPCCIYYPTCSNYAYEALKKHNLFKAFYLILKRILKCNPFFKGGYDPVP